MTRFGDFKPLCTTTPSYPWCNLFYKQLLDNSPESLTGLSENRSSAPVGINPNCGIPRVGEDGSISNIANIVVCALSILITFGLIYLTSRRKAAVGRSELRLFLILYLCTLPFQLLTTGSLLEQGSIALVVLTAVHAGFVATLFWVLLGNGIVSTQVVEDGTPSSLVPLTIFTIAFFGGTLYVALDVGLGFTDVLGPSDPPTDLRNIALFVLTCIWPLAATLIYFILMAYIVMGVLKEFKPFIYYIIAAICFVLSQLAYFLLGKVICSGTNAKVDGSFVATILETAAVVVLYLAWKSITEDTWDEDYYNDEHQFQSR